mgnify:CR=1 FL=1
MVERYGVLHEACSRWSPGSCTPVSSGALGDSVAESAFGDDWLCPRRRRRLLFEVGGGARRLRYDSIPHAATMTPVVEGMAAQAADDETKPGWRCDGGRFALGACFAGNGTATAASAGVVAVGIAQRARSHPISLPALHPLRRCVASRCSAPPWRGRSWVRWLASC